MNPFVHPLVGFLSLILAVAAFRLDSGQETRGAAHRILGTLSVVLGAAALWLGMQGSLGAAAPAVLAVHRFVGIITFGLLALTGILGVASEGRRKAMARLHGWFSSAVLILGGVLIVLGLGSLEAILR